MDVLIICQEAGFRRNISLSTVERELGTSTVTFGDLLRHLTASSTSLQALSRREELIFHYINQEGRLIPVRTRDAVRPHATYKNFFLQPTSSRASLSIPGYSDTPQLRSTIQPPPVYPPQWNSNRNMFIQGTSRRRFLIGLCAVAGVGLAFGGYELLRLPSPNQGTLYQENGADNWSGWKGTPDWKISNGMLINDGSGTSTPNCSWADPSIVAPIDISTSSFAGEAKIQVTSLGNIFGISVGGFDQNGTDSNGNAEGWNVWNGYAVESSGPDVCLAHAPGAANPVNFDPGTDWHTYRVEVKGQHAKLFIDNSKIIESDHIDFFGGKVGLFSDNTQLNVSNFNVFAI